MIKRNSPWLECLGISLDRSGNRRGCKSGDVSGGMISPIPRALSFGCRSLETFICLALVTGVLRSAAVAETPAFVVDGMFTDNMILQQQHYNNAAPTKIRGYAQAAKKLTVSFHPPGMEDTIRKESTSRWSDRYWHQMPDSSPWKYRWELELDGLKPGGPYDLKITQGSAPSILRTNVVVGEIWIIATQPAHEIDIFPGEFPDLLKFPAWQNHVHSVSIPDTKPAAIPPSMAWDWNIVPWPQTPRPELIQTFAAYFAAFYLRQKPDQPTYLGIIEPPLEFFRSLPDYGRKSPPAAPPITAAFLAKTNAQRRVVENHHTRTNQFFLTVSRKKRIGRPVTEPAPPTATDCVYMNTFLGTPVGFPLAVRGAIWPAAGYP